MNLNEKQMDVLTELINIGIGRSANILNQIVNNRVMLKVPKIQLINVSDLDKKISGSDEVMSTITLGFNGEMHGKVALVFTSNNAIKMVDLLTDKDYARLEMDQLRSSTLNEVGNIVLNSLIGTLGNILKTRFRYKPPQFRECKSSEIMIQNHDDSDFLIYAETLFTIKSNDIEGGFILIFEVGSLDTFLEKLNNYQL